MNNKEQAFNIALDRNQYETLIDTLSLALMTCHHSGDSGEHYIKMIDLFNEIANINNEKPKFVTEEKLDFVKDKYFYPACMTFYNQINENIAVATEVNVVEPITAIAEAIR